MVRETPLLMPRLVEDGVVEEERGGDGHEGEPQTLQAERGQSQDGGHHCGQHRSNDAANQNIEPEVVRQLGGGEGTDPGECGLSQMRAGRPYR